MKTTLFAVFLCSAWFCTAVSFSPYPPGKAEKLGNGETKIVFTPRKLSGAQFYPKIEPGNYDMIVKLKGNGRVFAGVSAGGWRFSPWWKLSTEFQEFRARFYVPKKSITVALFGADGATEAVVASLELKRLNLPPLGDTAIAGSLWSASDYAGPGVSRGEGTASAKHAHAALVRLPVPHTARPLYLSMQASGTGKVRIESCGQTLGTAVALNGKIFFGPFLYDKTNGMISVILTENLATPLTIHGGMFSTDAKAAMPARIAPRNKGFVAVGKTASAPDINGSGKDNAWLSAFPVSDFRAMNGAVPAAEKSSLRMLWDDKNLYLRFRGASYSLRRLSNDFTSFRKNVMQNDNDGIFYDDCFVFALHDRKNGRIFDFAVNANNALADGKMPEGKNMWSKRDLDWQSGATVKTSMSEGEWIAELAIPWTTLQIKPAEGMEFGFCAGRYDGKNRESSTWQPTKAGYHNTAEYGTLKLSKIMPEIKNIVIPDFLNHASFLRVESGDSAKLILEHHGIDFWSEAVAENNVDIPTGMPVPPAEYFYTLSDPVTRECLLRIPAFTPVSGIQKISCSPVTANAYLNGSPFTKGMGNLLEGMNLLAVRHSGGAAKPEFKTDGTRIVIDSTWRYSEKAPDGWNTPDFDDSAWNLAGTSAGKSGYYRKTLMLNSSVIWPNYQQDKLSINAGMVQVLGLLPNGIPGVETPEGYRMVFEVSGQLEMIGATGCFQFNPCNFEKLADQNGFRCYAVTLPGVKRFNTKPLAGHQVLKLFFRANDDAKGSGVIRFRAETPDQSVAELNQSIKVQFLPKLNPGMMKKIFMQLWVSAENSLNNVELQEKVYRAVFSSGINEIHGPSAVDSAAVKAWQKRNLPGHYFAVISMGS